jgi:acyl-CoA thioesterase FadM
MDAVLDFLPRDNVLCVLVRFEIGFLRKVCCRIRIPFHSKIVQYQSVDITLESLATGDMKLCATTRCIEWCVQKKKIDIVFPHYMLGEIPIDSAFITSPG